MRSKIAWTLLAIVIVALAAFAWTRSKSRSEEALALRPLAVVDGRTITAGRFNQSYIEYLLATGRNDTPVERYRHLDRLIRTVVLAREARKFGLDRSSEYESYLERNRRLAVGAEYFDEAMASELPPLSERDVREAFRNTRERVAIRHLIYRDEQSAREAWTALENGADFLDLARDLYGAAADDSTVGYLGYASYWDLDDAVAGTAYSLEVGRYSEPVRSRYGWHILRVEDRLSSPILTESDFVMHRAGIEGRERIRRNRLAGDEFVRSMMEALDVRVDDEGARAMVDAVRASVVRPDNDATVEASQRARVLITEDEIERVRRALSPETVLATLDLDGRRVEFTAGDFVRWLPELPYEEVRDRTIAAVGRALRNEVLAARGREMGLEDRPLVREAIDYMADTWLATQMREALRVSGRVEPTETEVADAFLELGYRKLESARADYWVVHTATFAEADSIASLIRGGADPVRFPGYESHMQADASGDGMEGHVRRAPLEQTVTGCLDSDRCFVLHVARRDMDYTRLEDKADEIRGVLRRLLPEERMTDSLLGIGSVTVDTVLFRSMMEEVPDDGA